MSCIIAIIGFTAPRFAIFLIWLVTDWMRTIEAGAGVFLGFLFMPYSTLVYIFSCLDRPDPIYTALMIVAIIVDAINLTNGLAGSKE